ncbi:hypothetical protein PR048_021513 [Dryococelus australis]|uniref:Reverse transcriptase n=1 Tax=Dryococelus australis TaxID=614101 RepID=A0ABQ9GYF8_9NEOP|nr:hypothetical protein PR048_021513 [Dryococelus australis]
MCAKRKVDPVRTVAGTPLRDPVSIAAAFLDHDSRLYSEQTIDNAAGAPFVRNITNRLSEDSSDLPRCEITDEEVALIVQHTPKQKLPGIDGIPYEFYQHYWSVVQAEFCNMLRTVINRNALYRSQTEAFTRAATAQINSAKTKLLDLEPEPHALRQVSPYVKTDELRTLGIKFMQHSEQLIKCNWDSMVHKVRGSLLTARLRNINIIQGAYIVNTYLLSQLWYVAHLFPMPKATEAQIRLYIGWFMWRRYQFRANREQLLLPADRGGLGLVDLKLKARALFEKTIIQQFTSENGEVTALHHAVWTYDHILPRHYLQALQGVKQTLIELPAGVSVTTSLLYKQHRRTVNVVPRVQLKWANLHWDTIWKNTADVELPTALRASAHSFVKDLTPAKNRCKRIFLDADDRCVICDHRDTALHRVTSCIYSRPLWTWGRRRIARRLDVAADDIREKTLCFLDLTAFATVKRRAVVWLLMNLIDFTVNTPTISHLREFVDRLHRAGG